jgi:hypothetical protein
MAVGSENPKLLADCSSRREEAHSFKSAVQDKKPENEQSLLTSAATRSLSRSFRSLKFKRLPGTADEARTSTRLLGDERAPMWNGVLE